MYVLDVEASKLLCHLNGCLVISYLVFVSELGWRWAGNICMLWDFSCWSLLRFECRLVEHCILVHCASMAWSTKMREGGHNFGEILAQRLLWLPSVLEVSFVMHRQSRVSRFAFRKMFESWRLWWLNSGDLHTALSTLTLDYQLRSLRAPIPSQHYEEGIASHIVRGAYPILQVVHSRRKIGHE